MRPKILALFLVLSAGVIRPATAETVFSGEKPLNNLASDLLEARDLEESDQPPPFSRMSDGWVFFAFSGEGGGTLELSLDAGRVLEHSIVSRNGSSWNAEAMAFVKKGGHSVRLAAKGEAHIRKLIVRAIPELIHCGLGYNPEIKSYGKYDLRFLEKDVLPNITTLIVPSSIQLERPVVDGWHRQGKKFIGEVGVRAEAKSAEEHFAYWTGFMERAPFLDGIIINEFIVNRPVAEWVDVMTPERLARMDKERAQYEMAAEAIRKMRTDARLTNKMIYAYIGGSGKKLNQEIIGTNFVRTVLDCEYRLALERYLHEMSSEKGSEDALRTFLEGVADWEAKEPGVRKKMIIAFGLFSMPPGGINKQPNVDYHVWMDRQMNLLANHPGLADIAGVEWWTSSLADEETVRFVGKLYRHYAIDGKKEMLTKDPLFLSHIQNADFEKGVENWVLHPGEEGSIAVKSFPRYGRIEGRFMGLGRPADPEHIGDTFLWMKRTPKGPNTFWQEIQNLEPGRLYSMKMFTCDYNDLVHPKTKKQEQANPFVGSIVLLGAEVDPKRSFKEMYASNPEPNIPVWITYHWKVFRAAAPTARIIVSDWPEGAQGAVGFGQEQTFNFLEIEPYHE